MEDFLRLLGARISARWRLSTSCSWILWPPSRCVCQNLHDIKLRITLSNSTDNIVCTASLWWRGEGGRSWCFHTRHDTPSSNNMDRNVSWRCYRQKHWTTHLQGSRLVSVQGLWCHVFSSCEYSWSIEGWIHSKRRDRLSQELVERILHVHTNLVLRESLDASLHHLLPWDIQLVIDESEPEPEVCEKV